MKLPILDELVKIAEAQGYTLDLEKIAEENPALYALLKEAGLLDAVKGMASRISPNQRFIQAVKGIDTGLAGTAQKALQQGSMSSRLGQWGQQMRMTPVQRVRAAGMKVLPGEARELTHATQAMGGTSVGKRMMGAAAEGAGHHMAHTGALGAVASHVGVPMGGALEGLVKQTGRELGSLGTSLRARAAQTGGQSAAGRMLSTTGSGLRKAAPVVGRAGELAGMAALPLPTAAGTIGGALGGIAGVGQLGGYAAHLGEKVLGTGVIGAGSRVIRT